MAPEKNPAAVALGKLRRANMTDEEKRAFQALGAQHAAEANRKRTRAECLAIARKAAMTRRLRPKWISAAPAANVKTEAERNPIPPAAPQARPASQAPAAPVPDLDELRQAIDDLPDETLAAIAAALAGRL